MDVAIIGGGVVGLATAWRASQRGLSACVIDPSPGSGASHAAAGMLAPIGEAHFGEEQLLALGLESWRRYPAFVEELEAASGEATGYRRSGSLFVARDADELSALQRERAYRERLGLAVRGVTSRECRAEEPRLAPGIRGGVLAEDDCQVDPRALVRGLTAACERVDVTVARVRAREIVSVSGHAAGVACDDGTVIRATNIVLCAGAWSPLISGLPSEAAPPVRPVKGQIVRLRAAAPLCARMVRGRDVYIVSRMDGEVVVGATVEERGFDTTVTAGAVYELLRDARDLVPDVTELEITEITASVRPGTPDNAPLIGCSALPGLLFATGHHRNGILLTPLTADAIADELTGASVPGVVRPFTPRRFERRAAVVA